MIVIKIKYHLYICERIYQIIEKLLYVKNILYNDRSGEDERTHERCKHSIR